MSVKVWQRREERKDERGAEMRREKKGERSGAAGDDCRDFWVHR